MIDRIRLSDGGRSNTPRTDFLDFAVELPQPLRMTQNPEGQVMTPYLASLRGIDENESSRGRIVAGNPDFFTKLTKAALQVLYFNRYEFRRNSEMMRKRVIGGQYTTSNSEILLAVRHSEERGIAHRARNQCLQGVVWSVLKSRSHSPRPSEGEIEAIIQWILLKKPGIRKID